MLSKELEVTLNMAFKEARAARHDFRLPAGDDSDFDTGVLQQFYAESIFDVKGL